MKLTPQKYAEILYEILADAHEEELRSRIVNFVKFLGKNRQLALSKKIIQAFENLYNQKQNITKIKIKTARDFAEKIVRDKFKGQLEIIKQIDKDLIGGAIFQINNLMIDGSLKKQLISLHKQLCQ